MEDIIQISKKEIKQTEIELYILLKFQEKNGFGHRSLRDNTCIGTGNNFSRRGNNENLHLGKIRKMDRRSEYDALSSATLNYSLRKCSNLQTLSFRTSFKPWAWRPKNPLTGKFR